MASVVGVGEGEDVGACAGVGAILDKLTNYYIFEVGVNLKSRLTAACVGANRKRI